MFMQKFIVVYTYVFLCCTHKEHDTSAADCLKQSGQKDTSAGFSQRAGTSERKSPIGIAIRRCLSSIVVYIKSTLKSR